MTLNLEKKLFWEAISATNKKEGKTLWGWEKKVQNKLSLKPYIIKYTDQSQILNPEVAACICNQGFIEVEFRNGVGPIPVWGNSPSIDGWIV